MPLLTLAVCLRQQTAMLRRLLQETSGLFDDLVVVHDGGETMPSNFSKVEAPPLGIDYAMLSDGDATYGYRIPKAVIPGAAHELVIARSGRFFEGPCCYQQESHWPFAWSQARHDWILRLDADEVPGDQLKEWLRQFRTLESAAPDIAGFTCIWPLWNGQRTLTRYWPIGRQFLVHRRRIRFFGMAEQTPVPIPPARFESVPAILEHRPERKSFGVGNLIIRPQAVVWRKVIAGSLQRTPTELPRWNWSDETWPPVWEQIRQRPLRTAFKRLLAWPIRLAFEMRRHEGRILLSAAISSGIHHFLIACAYLRLVRSRATR